MKALHARALPRSAGQPKRVEGCWLRHTSQGSHGPADALGCASRCPSARWDRSAVASVVGASVTGVERRGVAVTSEVVARLGAWAYALASA